MTELRCSKCGKICAYLAAGSKIANGAAMTCAKCLKPVSHASHDVPDFLGKLFGGGK